MGCCLVSLAAFLSPRFVIVFMWIFTNRLTIAFESWWMGFAGFLLLPWTTVMYAICYQPVFGISGFGYLLVAGGVVLDIASYAGGGRTAQQRQQQQIA
jgi:hypothetical protein